MREVMRRAYAFTLDLSWGGFVFLLPFTSLPFLSRLAGGTMVAPASFIPLVWLAIAWFVPYILRKGRIPRESLPLLLFASLAVISSAHAFFMEIPPFKGQFQLREELSSILNLMIGMTFYLVTAAWLNSLPKLHSTLKFINISGLIVLAWSFLQAFYIFFAAGQYPYIIQQIQSIISNRGLFTNSALLPRITGFAFEPSWLAQQINLLYLPIWLAASTNRFSTQSFRIWKFTLENILLAGGVIIVFLASRVGALAILVLFTFLLTRYNLRLGRRIHKRVIVLLPRMGQFLQKTVRVGLSIAIFLVALLIYLSGAIGVIYVLSRVDWRLTRFFDFQDILYLLSTSNFYIIINFFTFAERMVYWVAGWQIFIAHPLLGVGLGNAGFFFPQYLPSYAWTLPEAMDVFYRALSIPNIKSFWIRILAETGLAGFSAFLAWYYVLWQSSRFLQSSSRPLLRTIAVSGLFVLLAFVVEGFSTDTFALPYLWVSLGIVSAAASLSRNSPVEDAADRVPRSDANS
ncbi:MAG: hypothetical protein ABIF04_00825 [Chloroflexota bacterium]